MVAYDLALDEPRLDDSRERKEELLFVYDDKTIEEIGAFVKIDYIPSQGLKMINANQTLAYALSLKDS
ncbi:hypothetical protein JCM9140_373 [Halalkalibacter wakoensis JCM 9140]|uniref:Uncharacterized protein n=1 Tax=Halalkalibacter wakoensis JCM 9140 TaxID=1236970 RepID=W4PXQ7_9BACI|nr:hypothetical protein [Halalkalibacter wakoensis]GAE24445.1 hypothetical protein JCM9140_373 [Halalkalibacter wakoensis JCM 9140]